MRQRKTSVGSAILLVISFFGLMVWSFSPFAFAADAPQVTDLVVDRVTNSSARLVWSGLPDGNYEIRYSYQMITLSNFQEGFNGEIFDGVFSYDTQINKLVFTLHCLYGNKTYYVAVRSSSDGVSHLSNVVRFTTGENAAAGTVPTIYHVSRADMDATSNHPVIAWTSPTTPGWSKFVVMRKENSATLDINGAGATKVYEGTGTSFNDNNFAVNKLYYYSVFALNSAGFSGEPAILIFDSTENQGGASATGGTLCPNLKTPASTTTTSGVTVNSGGEPGAGTGGTATSHFSGTIVRYNGSSTLFLLEAGYKRPIPSYDIYQTYYSTHPLLTISANEQYPTGTAATWREGSVIKSYSSPTVYLVLSNGSKYGFRSEQEMYSFGYNWSMLHYVSDSQLDWYPNSMISSLTYHPTNSFIMYPGSAQVYMVDRQVLRPVTSPEVLYSYSDFSQVAYASNIYAFNYSSGAALPFSDGMLIKTATNPTIYLIAGGSRQPFSSLSSFSAYGYTSSMVRVIPDADLQLNPAGNSVR